MIPRPGRMQAAFTAGELDPQLHARTELKYHGSGLRRAENVQILPQGGFRVREGLRRLGSANAAAQRLGQFQNSQGTAYDLVLRPGFLDVTLDGDAVASVAIPLASEQECREADLAQQLDTLLIAQKDRQTHRVIQTAAGWSQGAAPLTGIPDHDYGGTYVNGVSAVWDLQFIGLTGDTVFTVSINDQTTPAIQFNADIDVLAAAIEAQLLALPGVAPGLTCTNPGGYARITFAGAGNAGDDWAVAARALNKGDAAVVARKSVVGKKAGEPVISSTRGWPRVAAFDSGQRLLLGGPRGLPNAYLVSQTGGYFTFDERLDGANGPFLVPLNLPGGETILRMVAGRNLMIFTSQGEYWVSDRALSKGTPPNHVKASSHGSAVGTPVVENEGSAIFCAASGNVLHEFRYNEVDGNFTTLSLSLLAAHLVSDVRDMALRKAASSQEGNTLAVVRGDGGLLLATLLREQEVTAFTRVTSPGLAFKAATRTGTNRLTLLAAAGAARELLRAEAGLLLDRAVTRAIEPASNTVDGLPHANGTVVWAIGDGDVFGPLTVSGGAVTLPRAVVTATVGTWSPPVAETLPPSREIGPKVVMKRKGRIHSVTLSLVDTTSVAIRANSSARVWDVPLRTFADALADQPELSQGFTGDVTLQGLTGFADEPTVTITQTRPGRLTVRAITLHADL